MSLLDATELTPCRARDLLEPGVSERLLSRLGDEYDEVDSAITVGMYLCYFIAFSAAVFGCAAGMYGAALFVTALYMGVAIGMKRMSRLAVTAGLIAYIVLAALTVSRQPLGLLGHLNVIIVFPAVLSSAAWVIFRYHRAEARRAIAARLTYLRSVSTGPALRQNTGRSTLGDAVSRCADATREARSFYSRVLYHAHPAAGPSMSAYCPSNDHMQIEWDFYYEKPGSYHVRQVVQPGDHCDEWITLQGHHYQNIGGIWMAGGDSSFFQGNDELNEYLSAKKYLAVVDELRPASLLQLSEDESTFAVVEFRIPAWSSLRDVRPPFRDAGQSVTEDGYLVELWLDITEGLLAKGRISFELVFEGKLVRVSLEQEFAGYNARRTIRRPHVGWGQA